MKNIEWLKEEVYEMMPSHSELYDHPDYTTVETVKMLDRFIGLIDQLDEPETLSQEWIDNHTAGADTIAHYSEEDVLVVQVKDLQNLLVPKQDEVDRAYKDGYEKGKQHTFYKGYLEGLTDKENEPETVADVIADFYKSLERFKEVLGTEVKELEE